MILLFQYLSVFEQNVMFYCHFFFQRETTFVVFLFVSMGIEILTKQGYKKNFMLNSAEYEIFPADKC